MAPRLFSEHGARGNSGFAGGDLLAVAPAAAQYLDEAPLGMDGNTSCRRFAHLAGFEPFDLGKAAGSDLARIEEMKALAAEAGPAPGAGLQPRMRL